MPIFIKKALLSNTPDWFYALFVNYSNLYRILFPDTDGIIRVIPHGSHWLVLRNKLRLLTPTSKWLGVNFKKFEERFEAVLKVERGETVLDVGACIGDTTIPFAMKVGENGCVIAVEPEPTNITYLKANVRPFKNVHIIEKAAWNRREKVKLYLHDSPTGHSIVDKFNKYIEVEADTLDNITKRLTRKIDFLKIDVQGVELQVLEGAEKLLESVNKVVVETHRLADKSTAPEVIEFLVQRNFKIKVFKEKYQPDNTFLEVVHAWKE
ncbi:MAG: FkbM family methyltransferase [Candidatus Bathyarchaeia archaeon]